MGLIKNRREYFECNKKYRAAKRKYQQHRNIFKKLLGYCPCCNRYLRYPVTTERRNTAYVEEASNWLTACNNCHDEDEAYFADLWDQYYSSI
jgi:cytochrome c553